MKTFAMKRNGCTEIIEQYTFDEWMVNFRPDGVGKISIGSFPGKIDTVTFTEVCCDFCNAEIVRDVREKENTRQSILHVLSGWTICEECAEQYKSEMKEVEK